MSKEDLAARLAAEFPEAFSPDGGLAIEDVRPSVCRVRQAFRPRALRPGGTLSGPTMMTLADVALYVAVLGSVGWVPLAVTTHLAINFLRKPEPRDLIADCRLLKLGTRLAVGEVAIRSDGAEALVAHATGTYSIPRLG